MPGGLRSTAGPADDRKLAGLIEPVISAAGLDLESVRMTAAGRRRLLRVVVDSDHGVSLDDAADVSRDVSALLDASNALGDTPYTLEVSSPGLDRKLSRPADFERFRGSRVKLTTRDPVGGNRHFEGRLEQFESGRLTLDLAEARKKFRPKQQEIEKLEIELANVEKANLVPEI